MTPTRRVTAAALAVAVLGVPVTLGVSVALAPAAEASTFRYWSYWWGERPGKPASWQYASQGPATHAVADTWVLGWRFATAPEKGAAPPRQSAAFATLCPGLDTPVDDAVRVALVIDYGSTADAPPGQTPPTTSSVRVECLTLPTTSRVTGSTALSAAGVPVRSEDGLICALDGYPQGECAPLVASPASRTPRPTSARPTPSASATPGPTRTGTRSPAPSRTATAGTAPAPAGTPAAASAASATANATSGAPSTAGSDPSTAASGSTTAATEVPGPDTVATPAETLPAASGSPVEPDTGSPVGFALGAVAVAAVAGAAWTASRRGGRA